MLMAPEFFVSPSNESEVIKKCGLCDVISDSPFQLRTILPKQRRLVFFIESASEYFYGKGYSFAFSCLYFVGKACVVYLLLVRAVWHTTHVCVKVTFTCWCCEHVEGANFNLTTACALSCSCCSCAVCFEQHLCFVRDVHHAQFEAQFA